MTVCGYTHTVYSALAPTMAHSIICCWLATLRDDGQGSHISKGGITPFQASAGLIPRINQFKCEST